MISKNAFYLHERNYKHRLEESKEDNEEIKFWKQEIGTKVLNRIAEEYGINLNILFHGEFDIDISAWKKMSEELKYISSIDTSTIELPKEYNAKDNVVFEPFFTHWIKIAIYKLKQKKINVNNAILKSFVENVFHNLAECSIRTLIFEMHVSKKAGELKGASSKEEYEYYVSSLLQDEEYLNALFIEYPVLLRLIVENIEKCVNNFTLLLERIERDHVDIVEKLCDKNDFTKIIEISNQMSDSHHGGAASFQIKLDNGYTIIYKPHTLSNEMVFQRMCKWCFKQCNIKSWEYNIVLHDTYGWVQYITYEECKSEDEVKNYFYRLGIQAFILYVFNAGDIHYENLISHGEFPQIVDCETMLENKDILKDNSANSNILLYLNDSVLHSGIFPYYTWSNQEFGVDLSALQGCEGQKVPILMPIIINEKTSEMALTYDYPVLEEKKNRVKLKNKYINPVKYSKYIIRGFKDIYEFAMHNRKVVMEIFLKEGSRILKSRQLMENTQKYALLINASFHPCVLHDARDRELLLSKIIDDSDERRFWVSKMEYSEMLGGDIPYFYSIPYSKDLYNASGKKYQKYYESESLNIMEDKIENMSRKNMEFQVEFIRDTLMDADQKQRKISSKKQLDAVIKENNTIAGLKKEVLKKCVNKIANEIANLAFYSENKDEVSWLAAAREKREESIRWRFYPINNSLYEGLSGIVIFLAALRMCNITDKYKNILETAINSLYVYTDKYAAENINNFDTNVGAMSGESSIVYTYLVLYKLLKKNKFLEYAIKHAYLLGKGIEADNNFDVLSGNAGAVLVLLQLYDLTGNRKILELVIKAGEKLVYNAKKQNKGIGWNNIEEENALAGFAHGNAGISLSLLKLWKTTGDRKFLQSFEEALEYEDDLFDSVDGNWRDVRMVDHDINDNKGVRPIAWCHGAGGILLSRIEMLKICPEKYRNTIHKDVEAAFNTIVRGGVFEDLCLCHGTLGNMMILQEYLKTFKNHDLDLAIDKIVNDTAQNIVDGKYVSPQQNSRFFLGLMLGSSGIGYAYLKFMFPDLPNVLLLEI